MQGWKIAKERVTVKLCCSASGEKLKQIFIGKANNPKCFNNINVTNLPVLWRLIMTETSYLEWIPRLNKL